MNDNNLFATELTIDIQRLTQSFDCGGASVFNSFIKGPQALDPLFGKTFVLVSEEPKSIIGYYNVGLGEVVISDGVHISKCGGAVHINYLAVDKNYRGQTAIIGTGDDQKLRWSDILLGDCLARIDRLRNEYAGFMFVTLSSSKDGFDLYHNRFGFELFADVEDMSFYDSDEDSGGGIKMYLPLDDEDV